MTKITKERLEQLATIRTTGATCSDLEEFEEILRLARIGLDADEKLEMAALISAKAVLEEIYSLTLETDGRKSTVIRSALLKRIAAAKEALSALPKEAQ